MDIGNVATLRESSTVQRLNSSNELVAAVRKAMMESSTSPNAVNIKNVTDSSVELDDKNHEGVMNSPNATTRPLLRVYVYENLPSEFTTDVEDFVTKQKYATMAKADNFGADVPIINLFRNYNGRTYDPTQADVFVVPYPHRSHCLSKLADSVRYRGGAQHCAVVPKETIDQLLASLSYLNMTTMKKHLFVLSGDKQLNDKRLEEMPLTLTLGPVSEMNDGNIVIPYLNNRPEFQPSVIYQRDEDWWTRPRKYAFSYYFGTSSKDMKGRYLRRVFGRKIQTYGTSIGNLPIRVKGMRNWTPENKEEAFEAYHESVFCPCLPGDFPAQKRFFDSMMSGCLPVVVSANTSVYPGRKSWFRIHRSSVEASYPFAKGMFYDGMEIDYESFVVQAQNVSDIKPAMEAILADPDELRRRQRNLRKFAPLVSYDVDANAPWENAFTQILKALKHHLDSSSARPGISHNVLPYGPKTSPLPKLTKNRLNRFIVVPEYKLLFCYVEKVGCSMFNHLFRMLRLHHPTVAENRAEVRHLANATWFRNTPLHHKLSKSDLEGILVNPKWTKAVFYRDPVMRFLSTYRDKCENMAGFVPAFCKAFVSPGTNSSNFDNVLAQIQNGTFKYLSNPHFAFASDFCGGLGNTIEYYDFVHELNSDTSMHVENLLNKIGIAPRLVRSLVDNTVRSKGSNVVQDRKRAAQLGVKLGLGEWHETTHNTDTTTATCDYFKSRDQIKLLEGLYSVDYNTFGMTPQDLNCTFNQ
jgi:hypothetical protein